MRKLLVILILAMIFSGCIGEKGKTGTGKYKDVFVLGDGKDHRLKSGKWGIGFFPKIHVLERLVEYDMSNDRYVPSLAESWEIKDRKIIFHLKRGIKFSDGTPFNAKAVKFSLDRMIANKESLAKDIENVEVIDEYTVAVTFKEGKFFNLAKFGEFHFGIMAPTSVTPAGDPNGTFVKPIGTGPFKVISYKEEQEVIYEPNEYWYKRKGIKPKFKKFIVKIIPDDETRVMALRSGEVDAITDFIHGGDPYTPRNQLPVLEREGYKIYKRNVPITWIIAFNYQKEPMSDPEIRKAFNLAINRQEIKKLFEGYVRAADKGMFAPEVPGMKEAEIEYEYNPEKAKEILKGKRVKLDFIVSKGENDQILVAQLLKEQLKKAGFDVNLRILEPGAYRQERKSGNYDIRLYYIGGTDRRFYLRLYWRFDPEREWKAYSSDRVGKLCRDVLKEFDSSKRKEKLIEMYRAIYNESGVAPLYHDMMTVITRDNVDVGNLFEMPEPNFAYVGVKK